MDLKSETFWKKLNIKSLFYQPEVVLNYECALFLVSLLQSLAFCYFHFIDLSYFLGECTLK